MPRVAAGVAAVVLVVLVTGPAVISSGTCFMAMVISGT